MDQQNCPHGYRAFNEDGQVINMACDSWTCPICQKANAYRWAERLRYGLALRGNRDAYFWTLTLPAYIDSAERGYAILPTLWDRLRREMKRFYKSWDYAAFVEGHPQRGHIPHFHIISLAVSPYRLKDLAARCGFGYMAMQLPCNGKMAAIYVSKYVSKQGFGMPKGFRRVRISRAWPRLPDPAYDKRIFIQQPRESLKAYVRRVSRLTGQPYQTLMDQWLASKGNTAI